MANGVSDLAEERQDVGAAGVALAPAAEIVPTSSELAMFFQVAKDMDIGKLKELIGLYREMDTQRRKDEYSKAFKAAQDEMKPVAVDKKNEQTGSMYATLEKVSTELNPVIKRHGFTMSYGSKEPNTPGNICVTCRVRHIGGWHEDFQLEGPPDDKGIKGTPNKTGIQGLVSSASYLRRVLKLMIWDITVAGFDRDGNQTEGLTDDEYQTIKNLWEELTPSPKFVDNFKRFFSIGKVEDLKHHQFNEAKIRLKEALERKRGQ